MGKGSGIVMKNILCGGLLLLLCLAGPTASGAAGPSFGTVTGTKVNLRAEPSTSAAVVLRFDGGELVEVLEKSGKKKGEQHPWYRVTTGDDGEKGWIYGQFLAVDVVPPKFALLAHGGSRVLLLSGGESRSLMEQSVVPRYTHCISSGRIRPVTFEAYRQPDPEWNGRQTSRFFDDLGGFLFRVEGGALPFLTGDVGGDVLLVDSEYADAAEIVPLEKGPEEAPGDVKKRFEELYKRSLKEIVGIARGTDSEVAVYAMEFTLKGDKALGVVALVTPRGTFCLDFPATYDEQSTWNVDDGGEFFPRSYVVGSLLKKGESYVFTLHRQAAESYTSHLVAVEGGKLVAPLGSSSSRYIAPE